jgi:hypothetical protein
VAPGVGGQPAHRGGYELAGGHETLATSVVDGDPQAVLEMPHASPWPILLAGALLVTFYAVLLDSYPLATAAGVACVVCMAGWFWPKGETQET